MTVETDELLLDLASRHAAGEVATSATGPLDELDVALARMLGEGTVTLRDVPVATPTAALADVLAGRVAPAPPPWPARIAAAVAGLGLAGKVALGAGVAVAALGVAHHEGLLPDPLERLFGLHLGGTPDHRAPITPDAPSEDPTVDPRGRTASPGDRPSSDMSTPASPHRSTSTGPGPGVGGSDEQGDDSRGTDGSNGSTDGGGSDGSGDDTGRDTERPDPSDPVPSDGSGDSGDAGDATQPSDPDPAEPSGTVQPSDTAEPSDPLDTAGADGGSSDRDVAGQRIRISWNDSPSSET